MVANGLTNAQVALFAAVEGSKNQNYTASRPHRVIEDAERYLEWLDNNS